MKRALVTGSAGFVGRHIVQALAGQNYMVDCVDLATGVDCRDYFHHVDTPRFDLVVHCAAVVGGRATIDGEPLRLMTEDLSIDAALFAWALRTRPTRIVYFSSSAAYPIHLQRKGLEVQIYEAAADVGQPDATYGFVKRVGERLAAEANAAGIKTHVFRPFSGYGTDQPLDYPFPAFIRRALDREEPFRIWGDGGSARDWIHIDDIVAAVFAAIDHAVLGPVNLCTGRATTFDELAKMVLQRAGHSTRIEYDTAAPRGVHWRVGDPTKMLEFYTPRITLEEGIARALAGQL